MAASALRATKVRRTIRKQKAKVVKDATLLKGIKQGVGMVVKRPFGSGRSRPGKSAARNKPSHSKAALCALTNIHLPLPRAVGAYTVVKTTTTISSNQSVTLFGCMKAGRSDHSDPTWYNVVGVGSVDRYHPIGGASNARFLLNAALASSGFEECRLVPAALTVQVMCPKSLQAAEGITYIGRTKQVMDLAGDTRTWETLAEELVSYSAPRLCSAGKLALRGVKVDAIPYNMTQMADFAPRGLMSAPAEKTWGGPGNTYAQFEGFAPIFCYNKDNVDLQYLVTVEWRTRFDPGNPAYAGHSYHPVASDSLWNNIVKGMETEGHGVVDLAEGIADFGDAAMTAVGSLF